MELIKPYPPHILRLWKLQKHYLLINLVFYQHWESDFPVRKETKTDGTILWKAHHAIYTSENLFAFHGNSELCIGFKFSVLLELSNKTIYNVTRLTTLLPADRVHLLSLSVAEAFINTQITAYYTYTQRRGHFILQLPSVELWFLHCNTQAAQKSHNRALLLILGNIPSFSAYK